MISMNASTMSKGNKYENLMLLEFMINCVTFFESAYIIDRDYLDQLEETKVAIKFKNCCLVEILEEENSKCEIDEHGNKKIYFGNGKSCLVSLNQIANTFDQVACIDVSRRDPCGGEKNFFKFGEAKMSLEPIFKEIKKGNRGNKIKSLKGSYKFIDRQCTEAGSIDIFVRGTNLGKKIITMFQLGAGESSFYFKGTEADPCSSDEDDESSCFACPQLNTTKESNAASSLGGCIIDQMGPLPNNQFTANQFIGGQFPGSQFQANMTYPKEPSRPVSNQPRTPCSQRTICTSRPRSAAPFNQPEQSYLPVNQYRAPMPGAMGGGPGMGMGGFNMGMGGLGMGMAGAPNMGMGFGGQGMGAPGMSPPNMSPPGFQGQMMQDALSPYQQEGPLYRDEDYEQLGGNYKEISAEVNGYEIKIKVLRRPKKEQ